MLLQMGSKNMPVGFAGNMQIEKYKGFEGEIAMNKNYFPEHIWLFNYLLEHGIPEKEAEYAVNRITNSVRQLDSACCDNFRFSVNGENADRYETIRSMGCCGFFDDEITLKSGNVIKYGFNYGH